MTTAVATPGMDCDRQGGLVPVREARRLLLAGLLPVDAPAEVALSEALGRVLAADTGTPLPLPPFDRAAVDGYGVGSLGQGPFTIVGRVTAGGAPPASIAPSQALRLLTGARVPEGVAAVAMSEACSVSGAQVNLAAVPRAGENIRRRGEEAERGDVLLRAGAQLDARHIALLASAGIGRVAVRRRPRVAVLSAGDELAEPGTVAGAAGVFDSNRPMLRAVLAGAGAEVVDLGILPDDRDAIAATLRGAAACDAILASGGVAGSEADHLLGALRQAGGEGAWMPIALKPGKPLVFGWLGGARCLFLPGNPVAALVGAVLFARPLLETLSGALPRDPGWLPAVAKTGWERRPGREEFVPARISGSDAAHRLVVDRLARAGSARLLPLVAAEGLMRVPTEAAHVQSGSTVRFLPFSALGLCAT